MIKGDYDYLQNLSKFNVCAEHQSPLEVAWYGQEKTWVLRCGQDHFPDALIKRMSLTEEYRAGAELPEPILSNVKKGMRRRAMQQGKAVTPYKFEGVPNKDLATGELLAPEQVFALVEYALKYKLDPFRGHVCLMYSKPYITIDGYLYHASRSGEPYSLISRPMTTDEYKAYQLQATDHGWISEVVMTRTGAKFMGIGIVTYDEMTAKSPRDQTKLRSPVVAAHPWQLGQKRAEWQALRRAFPIGEGPEAAPEKAAGHTEERLEPLFPEDNTVLS